MKKPVTGWAAESNFVDHLESSTFAEYIKNNPSVLVMFYAPCTYIFEVVVEILAVTESLVHGRSVEHRTLKVDQLNIINQFYRPKSIIAFYILLCFSHRVWSL